MIRKEYRVPLVEIVLLPNLDVLTASEDKDDIFDDREEGNV